MGVEDIQLGRILAESLAIQLASCSKDLIDDAEQEGMHPHLIAGLRAAKVAFDEHASKGDVDEVFNAVHAEVRDGLTLMDFEMRRRR